MKKPENWDNVATYDGDIERLTLGGHYLTIKGAKVVTFNGVDYLSIAFDTSSKDAQPGFFNRRLESMRSNNPEANWPNAGTIRFGLEGKGLPFTKGFIKSVEESNPGYHWNWAETTLIGKAVGGVFGEEEYKDQSGNIRTAVKCRFIRSIATIEAGVTVPDKKTLSGSTPSRPSSSVSMTEIDDEPLPF